MNSKRRHFIGASTVLAAMPRWAHAAHSPAGSARPQLGISAAFDRRGRLWVASIEPAQANGMGPAPSHIILSWTADQGNTWTRAASVLEAPEAVEANGEGRPKIAFGPGADVYVTFTRPLDQPHTGYIRFARSGDGGRTFSAPLTLQRDLAPIGHRFDSIMVDPRGRIFIAWIDKRDLAVAKAEKRPYRGAAVYYAVSTDGGRSFSADIRVADHCCECCRIALALTADGQVQAMWRHIFEPNVRDHAMATLSAGGKPGPVIRATQDNWQTDACPHHGPSLAYDRAGGRHQVWFTGAEEGGGLFYQKTAPGERAATPVRLGGVRAEHGEVLAVGSSVAVVWKEFDGDRTQVMVRVQTGGGRWHERSLASTRGTSDHPHLARSGSGIWMVWRTQDDGVLVREVAA